VRSGAKPLARQHHTQLVEDRVLRRYIDDFSVTGLTSNPTIFDHAIKNGKD
jgi:transaldolase